MSWFSILQVDTQYVWVLYAGNNHEVLRSARSYNQPQHARDAARRLHRIMGRADFNYGVGFKGRTPRRVPA